MKLAAAALALLPGVAWAVPSGSGPPAAVVTNASGQITAPSVGDVSGASVASGRTAGALSTLVDQHTATIASKADQTALTSESTTARANETAASNAAAAAQTTANAAIPTSKIGAANGVAGLNASGQLTNAMIGDGTGVQMNNLSGITGATAISEGKLWTGRSTDIKQFGAACDGTTNDYTPYVNAQLYHQGKPGTVYFPEGCKFYSSTGMTNTSNTADEFGAFVTMSGSLDGLESIDPSVSVHSWSWADSLPKNTNEISLGMLVKPTGSTSNYQKNMLEIRGESNDPSTSGYHDFVGLDLAMGIFAGNTTGRVWGEHGSVNVPATSNGQAIAGEFEIYNDNATLQSVPGTTTSKIGLHVDCNHSGGVTTAASCTSGIHISGGSSWYSQLDFDRGAMNSSGYAYRFFDTNQTMWASLSYLGVYYGRSYTDGIDTLSGGTLTLGKATDAVNSYLPTLAFSWPAAASTDSTSAFLRLVSATKLSWVINGSDVFDQSTNGATYNVPLYAKTTFQAYGGIVSTQTGAYTIASTDCGSTIRYNSSSAANITVPSGLGTGCRVVIAQIGSGAPTVVGSGVTLEAASGATTPTAQYRSVTILTDSSSTALVDAGL